MVVTPLRLVPTALLRRGTRAFADDLASLILSVKPSTCETVGVSLNGVLDNGRVVFSGLMGGEVNFPLLEFLSDRLRSTVFVDDDIHAMTVAEAKYGAGSSTDAFAMLNIGTGIGVGCYTDEVLRGRYAAGLISEQVIYVEELKEYRSLDRTVSGRGIKEIYHQLSGQTAEAINVFSQAQREDEAALATVRIFSRYLGQVLQLTSRFYHPEIIFLNGSIKHAAGDYLDAALRSYSIDVGEPLRAEVQVSTLEHAAELGTLSQAQNYRDEG